MVLHFAMLGADPYALDVLTIEYEGSPNAASEVAQRAADFRKVIALFLPGARHEARAAQRGFRQKAHAVAPGLAGPLASARQVPAERGVHRLRKVGSMGGHGCTWGQGQCPLCRDAYAAKSNRPGMLAGAVDREASDTGAVRPRLGQPGFVTSAACGPFCP